jgi:hypothetical protein
LSLAPTHDPIPAKTRVAAYNNLHARPCVSDVTDDMLQFFHCAFRGVYVARPQSGAEQKLSAENVKRQTAVVFVVAVEESPLLVSVQRIKGNGPL